MGNTPPEHFFHHGKVVGFARDVNLVFPVGFLTRNSFKKGNLRACCLFSLDVGNVVGLNTSYSLFGAKELLQFFFYHNPARGNGNLRRKKPCMGNNTLQTSSTEPNLQWHLDGSPIPSANQQTLIMTASGYYHLTVTNAFGCVSTSDTLSFDIVGIDETEGILKSVRLYPNPNKGQFNLSFTTIESQNVVISISDIFGRIVYFNEPGNIHGLYSTSFNLENLNPGLYFFKISFGSNSLNKKLVIH